MSLWEDVKKNVRDLYSVTSDKTTEIAKISSRRWDKFGISRDIERQFGELGNLVYTGLKEGRKDILEDAAVSVLMTKISALEKELKLKEEEIARIKEELRARKAAEATSGGPDVTTAEDEGASPETILKNPVLDEGRDESAILVEPVSEQEKGDGTAPEEDESRES